MQSIPLLMTGSTGLTGRLFLQKLSQASPNANVSCLVRPTSKYHSIEQLNLNFHYLIGDSTSVESWKEILNNQAPEIILHIAQLRHIPAILESLNHFEQTPRLIIIGTTGIYSKYNEYSGEYKDAEAELEKYSGSYCILRPTMIYGSPRDKNIHRVIKFCDRRGFFPIFGNGENLLQPIHADDLAQALLTLYQNPNLQGAYDLSGGSIVSFKELLNLVSKYLGKPVRQVSLPFNFGVWSAGILENLLSSRSPVRKEQILRLQEDKAFPHDRAKEDFGFSPRTFEVGLKQEVELMRQQGLISSS